MFSKSAAAILAASAALIVAVMAEPASPSAAPASGTAVATFAAGCFWCTEADFDKVPGVVETISGFMGGRTKNPTYEQVSAGDTGHAEAVQVKYDPAKVSYETLLDTYWRNVDPVDGGGQFCDRGDSYRPVIFTHTPEQKAAAEASKAALEKSGRFTKPIAVAIEAASEFTPAASYHQNFAEKNPLRYKTYRYGCGRDARLRSLWGARA